MQNTDIIPCLKKRKKRLKEYQKEYQKKYCETKKQLLKNQNAV